MQKLGSREVTKDPCFKQVKKIPAPDHRVSNCHIKANMLTLKLRADQELAVSEELNLNLACPDVVPSYIHTPYAY